ncbi:MAG: FtsQ-type POTRA domain-containing protein [Polyangiaceae bacterium]
MSSVAPPRNTRRPPAGPDGAARKESVPPPKESADAGSPEPPRAATMRPPPPKPGPTANPVAPNSKKKPEKPAEPKAPKPPLSVRFPKVARAVTLAKLAIGLAIVIVAALGVAWGGRKYMTTSPRFAIRTVTVDGASRLSPKDIAARGGIRVGDNVLVLDLDGARKKIEADPWVKSATVTRKLPGSVMVSVVEHEPAALVAIEDHLFLASRAGDVFKEVAPGDPMDLPVITGLTAKNAQQDREGVKKDVARAVDVIDEVEQTEFAKRYPLQEVHLVKDGSVEVVVGHDAIALHLGVAPYRGKLEQAERVFAECAARKVQPSIVFLDNESSPERVVVRMR